MSWQVFWVEVIVVDFIYGAQFDFQSKLSKLPKDPVRGMCAFKALRPCHTSKNYLQSSLCPTVGSLSLKFVDVE